MDITQGFRKYCIQSKRWLRKILETHIDTTLKTHERLEQACDLLVMQRSLLAGGLEADVELCAPHH